MLAHAAAEARMGGQRVSRPRHSVTLYTKEDCGLCQEAREVLQRLQRTLWLDLREVDITSDMALLERYAVLIPVVVIDGAITLTLEITEARLREALLAMEGKARR